MTKRQEPLPVPTEEAEGRHVPERLNATLSSKVVLRNQRVLLITIYCALSVFFLMRKLGKAGGSKGVFFSAYVYNNKQNGSVCQYFLSGQAGRLPTLKNLLKMAEYVIVFAGHMGIPPLRVSASLESVYTR